MEREKVIICMSTYNGERFLSQQLDSIIAQSFQNWLLVVHDDGSTDQTLSILANYADADNRIHLSKFTQHMGVKKSFLNLLREYDGDYYAFSDQDDEWQPDKLSTLVDLLQSAEQKQPLPLLIHSAFSRINAKGQRLSSEAEGDIDPNAYQISAFNQFLVENSITGCTCMLNHALREILIAKLRKLDFASMTMHDWWAGLLASAFGQVLYTPKHLVRYRQHESNVVGAPPKSGRAQRLLDAWHLKNIDDLRLIQLQAKMLDDLYGDDLDQTQRVAAKIIANLYVGWHPIRKWHELKDGDLMMHAWWYNLQIMHLLWLPVSSRQRRLSQ